MTGSVVYTGPRGETPMDFFATNRVTKLFQDLSYMSTGVERLEEEHSSAHF